MSGRRGLLVAISASLVVGCAIGLIVGVLFARSVLFPHPPTGRRFGGGPAGPRAMMHLVERRLDLTSDQSRRIERILDDVRAHADSMRESTRVRILEVLTPEQREKWERMNRRMFPGRGRLRGRDRPPPPEEP